MPHQRHAEDHRIRRAVRGAKRQEQRAHVHVSKRLPLLHLHEPHFLRERLQRVVGVGQPRNNPSRHLPLMARQTTHRPRAVGPTDILERTRRIIGMRIEPVTFHRHPPPLLERSLFGPAPERLGPRRPKGVEHLLVEVRRQVGASKQKFEAVGAPLPSVCRRADEHRGKRCHDPNVSPHPDCDVRGTHGILGVRPVGLVADSAV